MRVVEQYSIFEDVGYHGPEGMKNLAQKLDEVLLKFPVIDCANGTIYLGQKGLTITANVSSKSPLRYLWSRLRSAKDYLKPKSQRYSDLKINVIIDDDYAEVNFYDPQNWKRPIYDAVVNTLLKPQKL